MVGSNKICTDFKKKASRCLYVIFYYSLLHVLSCVFVFYLFHAIFCPNTSINQPKILPCVSYVIIYFTRHHHQYSLTARCFFSNLPRCSCECVCNSLPQDERNQILTTAIWLEQVKYQ